MACATSSSPLSALSKHLESFSSATASSPRSSTHSFRSCYTSKMSKNGDRELDAFARSSSSTECQVEFEHPPPAFAVHSCHRFAPNSYELPRSTVNVDNAASSPYWAPEQETLHALSSSPASSISSLLSRRYSVPDEDEAASICSTPPTSCGTSIHALSKTSSRSHLNGGSGSSDYSEYMTSAHPLTLFPSSHTAWDFDKLFSRRRHWFGGVRVPGDTIPLEEVACGDCRDEHPMSTAAEGERGRPLVAKVMMDRADRKDRQVSAERRLGRRSLSGSRLRPCEEGVLLSSAGVAPSCGPGDEPLGAVEEEEVEKKERQREAFERLRQCAMTRLEAVARHLEKPS